MNAARVYWQLTLEDAFMEKICHQYVIATLFLIFAGLFSRAGAQPGIRVPGDRLPYHQL